MNMKRVFIIILGLLVIAPASARPRRRAQAVRARAPRRKSRPVRAAIKKRRAAIRKRRDKRRLLRSIHRGQSDRVKQILERHPGLANVQIRRRKNKTPLHLVAGQEAEYKGAVHEVGALQPTEQEKERIRIVSYLLDKDANPNMQDRQGSTPLHLAAQKGHAEIAHDLLSKGAKPGIRDKSNNVPLNFSAAYAKAPDFGVAHALLPRMTKKEINTINNIGDTPLDDAHGSQSSLRKHMVDLLKKHGAKRASELK